MFDDVTDKSRFELKEAGLTVFATYRRTAGVLELLHVEAPPALRGTGAAGRLMDAVLDTARRRGEKVRPICPYAAAYMRRRPETRDLTA